MLLLTTCFSRSTHHTLALCAGLWLSVGCQEKKPAVASAPVVKPAPPIRPKPAAPAAPKTACSLVDDEVAEDPFGAEITVEELLQDGATVVARRPFHNRHEQNQVDTILILRHQGNQFEFYRAPEKDLLREVAITDFKPAYGQQLQQKLSSAYQARYARQTGRCDSLRIGDSNRLNTVAMTLQNGQLRAVQVQYYVD